MNDEQKAASTQALALSRLHGQQSAPEINEATRLIAEGADEDAIVRGILARIEGE